MASKDKSRFEWYIFIDLNINSPGNGVYGYNIFARLNKIMEDAYECKDWPFDDHREMFSSLKSAVRVQKIEGIRRIDQLPYPGHRKREATLEEWRLITEEAFAEVEYYRLARLGV